MEVKLICIGKTDDSSLQKLISIYENRLKHYIKFTLHILPDIKNTKKMSIEQQKTEEAILIKKQIQTSDVVILLDENGKEFSSIGFSKFLSKKMISSCKRLVFIIGGPYGFSEKIYQKYFLKVALSQMTFSHQIIRLLFVEQLYRANTILKNKPYHHS